MLKVIHSYYQKKMLYIFTNQTIMIDYWYKKKLYSNLYELTTTKQNYIFISRGENRTCLLMPNCPY